MQCWDAVAPGEGPSFFGKAMGDSDMGGENVGIEGFPVGLKS